MICSKSSESITKLKQEFKILLFPVWWLISLKSMVSGKPLQGGFKIFSRWWQWKLEQKDTKIKVKKGLNSSIMTLEKNYLNQMNQKFPTVLW